MNESVEIRRVTARYDGRAADSAEDTVTITFAFSRQLSDTEFGLLREALNVGIGRALGAEVYVARMKVKVEALDVDLRDEALYALRELLSRLPAQARETEARNAQARADLDSWAEGASSEA